MSIAGRAEQARCSAGNEMTVAHMLELVSSQPQSSPAELAIKDRIKSFDG